MAEHTPGPWEAVDCGNKAEWDVVKPDPAAIDCHWYVATCHDCADGVEAEHNARLIAAAPELLEAAESLLARLYQSLLPSDEAAPHASLEWQDAKAKADALSAAIAKARGVA